MSAIEEVVEPVGVFADADFKLAEVLFFDLGEVDGVGALELEAFDFSESNIDEIGYAVGVTAEADG